MRLFQQENLKILSKISNGFGKLLEAKVFEAYYTVYMEDSK